MYYDAALGLAIQLPYDAAEATCRWFPFEDRGDGVEHLLSAHFRERIIQFASCFFKRFLQRFTCNIESILTKLCLYLFGHGARRRIGDIDTGHGDVKMPQVLPKGSEFRVFVLVKVQDCVETAKHMCRYSWRFAMCSESDPEEAAQRSGASRIVRECEMTVHSGAAFRSNAIT
ncbi:hypothetical protein WM25_10685 [Burkholderia ubonensis]|nr:hypothetical protein WM25_10685 [Burkholderia ubonensis]